MRKIFLVAVLLAGATTLAAGGRETKGKAKKAKKSIFWTCTVGDVTMSSQQFEDPCAAARAFYCAKRKDGCRTIQDSPNP